jgi:ubiquinone/menaquinone biosynthesis C-methylase UbiE
MKSTGRGILLRILPPVVVDAFRAVKRRRRVSAHAEGGPQPEHQELQVYWDEKFADDVSEWGRGNVWDEILFLMAGRSGRVLDVACGTGVNIAEVGRLRGLEIHGCDISDVLINRAVLRGIPAERLTVCDASKMPYSDHAFEYGYSIGSLEHFDVASLESCVRECRRIIRGPVFHMVPVSRSGKDEGWVRRQQSFHNNSVDWWLNRFRVAYKSVEVLSSRWDDDISVGKWFVCLGEEESP